jgi:RNA polymerase sigma-70 factor (ECF subfamily)
MGAGEEAAANAAVPASGWVRRRRVHAGASDAELVRHARRGSQEAVELLVRRHWDAAHHAAYLVVRDAAAAEDIAQEALLAAVGALNRFDRRRPFGPWLHRIVVNRSLDWLRAAKRRDQLAGVVPVETHVQTEPDAALDRLSDVLGELDPESRAALVLRHVFEYRSPEIARMLDMPPSTVRTRLERARSRLRELLDAAEGES